VSEVDRGVRDGQPHLPVEAADGHADLLVLSQRLEQRSVGGNPNPGVDVRLPVVQELEVVGASEVLRKIERLRVLIDHRAENEVGTPPSPVPERRGQPSIVERLGGLRLEE